MQDLIISLFLLSVIIVLTVSIFAYRNSKTSKFEREFRIYQRKKEADILRKHRMKIADRIINEVMKETTI